MNWFEPLFFNGIEYGGLVSSLWYLGMTLFLGAAVVSIIFSKASVRLRLGGAILSALFWEFGIPDTPLGLLPGRFSNLQGEVMLIGLALLLGLIGIARSLRRTKLHVLPVSIAALMIALLSYSYHLVLINGLDGANRKLEAASLATTLDLEGDAREQYCALPGRLCGTGFPQTKHTALNRNIADWVGAVLPGETEGRIWSSEGTLSADPAHIWAAERVDGAVRWIMEERGGQTVVLKFAFFLMALLALVFWALAAALVEWLHRRRSRASRKLSE